MAATGATPISLYYSTTASATPTAGNLVNGELAININDGKLFYKDSSGVVQTLATKGTAVIGGSNTQVQYNSSGSFAGSANMTFDGTSLSLTNQLNLTNASNYNLYASGAGNNYMAGSLGVGGTTSAYQKLGILGTYNNDGSSQEVVSARGEFAGTVTSNSTFISRPTVASGAALTNLFHFNANPNTFTGTVTTQHAYSVSTTLNGATNNYAYYSSLAAASGAWNLYMAGTANNYLAGSVGIGTANLTGYNLRLGKTIAGALASFGTQNFGTIQSDVTTSAQIFDSVPSTAAASFTVTILQHYSARFNVLGAGSAITTQQGYIADSTLTTATNNFGFYGGIAAATGRYNLYMAGTANNYLAGSLGIGSTSLTSTNLLIAKTATGATTAYGARITSTFQSDVTSGGWSFMANPSTQAASFTLAEMAGYVADNGTIGAGSTVTSQYGFFATSGLTGATNNYAYRGSIAAATGRYNLYMNGTADNYLAGKLTVSGGTAIPAGGTAGVGVNLSTTANFGVFFGSGAPTLSAAKGSLYLRSDGSATNNRMYVNTDGSTTWTAVTTAA